VLSVLMLLTLKATAKNKPCHWPPSCNKLILIKCTSIMTRHGFLQPAFHPADFNRKQPW